MIRNVFSCFRETDFFPPNLKKPSNDDHAGRFIWFKGPSHFSYSFDCWTQDKKNIFTPSPYTTKI